MVSCRTSDKKSFALREAFLNSLITFLLGYLLYFRMWFSTVAGHAAYLEYGIFLSVFCFGLKKVFVDLIAHLDHLTGRTFLRFLIACHIPIRGINLHMAKLAIHTERFRKLLHDFFNGLL